MRLATIMLIFLALGACSGGKNGDSNTVAGADTFDEGPSGADVNSAVLQSATSFFGRVSPNISLLATAKKLNGQPITVAGADGYRDFIAVDITFPDGLRPECTRPGPLCIAYAGPPPTRYKTVVSYQGTIEASKIEQGWIINSVNIDYSKPINTVVDTPLRQTTPHLMGIGRGCGMMTALATIRGTRILPRSNLRGGKSPARLRLMRSQTVR